MKDLVSRTEERQIQKVSATVKSVYGGPRWFDSEGILAPYSRRVDSGSPVRQDS
jgi:hypothetical protein